MALQKNQTIPLGIDAIASDGNGLGRHEGQVVFVPGAAVGDVLDVKITKVQKRHAYGIIAQIKRPGPGRVTPDCPIGGKCGGCAFRHLSYTAELEAKRGFVADALARIGHIPFEVPPVLPSPLVDRYRNKVAYPVAPGPDGALQYGFYAARSHRVLPCEDCLLQPEPLNRIAARVAALLRQSGAEPYDEATGEGLVRHILLRQGVGGEVLLCLVLTRLGLPDAQGFAKVITGEFPQIAGIVLNRNPAKTNVILGGEDSLLYGGPAIPDEVCGVPVRLDVHSFAQVNRAGAEGLFAKAKEFATPGPEDVLLDLYCGTGVIGLSMAAGCKQLVGVDIVPQAVEAAKASARAMGMNHARFLCADAGAAAEKLEAEGLSPDVITLDPPRKGADEATLAALLRMAPGRIVMVSCNPATLARDLAVLTAGGYALKAVQPADMFPRTRHVECVCLLERQI